MELTNHERYYLMALLKSDIEDERLLLRLWLEKKNYFMIQATLKDIFKANNLIKKLDE